VPTQGISRTTGGVGLRHGLVALSCFVAVGCAEVTNAPMEAAAAAARPTEAVTSPLAADVAVTPEPLLIAPVAAVPDSGENSIEESTTVIEPEPLPPLLSHADLAPEASEPAVVAPAAPAAEALEPEQPVLTPSLVASTTAEEALDFSSLVTRLRKTKAINLRTKLAVKNESDDLLEQARVYHTQTGETTLADLRRSYDSLFQELQSLLEDADPPLARDIDRSRGAIWELLADPAKFNASI
jgi:hypothetical protein